MLYFETKRYHQRKEFYAIKDRKELLDFYHEIQGERSGKHLSGRTTISDICGELTGDYETFTRLPRRTALARAKEYGTEIKYI